MIKGNIDDLVGAVFMIVVAAFCIFSFIRDIVEKRIDHWFGDIVLPLLMIVLAIGTAIFGFLSYSKSLTPKCYMCGSSVTTDYCTNCGASTVTTEEEYICVNCNKPLDTEYCGDCGDHRTLVLEPETTP